MLFLKVVVNKMKMLLAVYIKNKALESNPRLAGLVNSLRAAGCGLYRLEVKEDLLPGTDAVISVGGDGTFLSASKRIADSGVPILGVNMGRLGFLSEVAPEDACKVLIDGNYILEDRTMLQAEVAGKCVEDYPGYWKYALNEITVHRSGAAILGINVKVNGEQLPTYWADGLIVATSSGSTAYSLSAGGPICTPDAKVLIIAPIAPHNLNVRPLVVPETSRIEISTSTRDGRADLTMDNRTMPIDCSSRITVSMAQFSLKRITLPRSSFVNALVSKLFWGEDIRNNGD